MLRNQNEANGKTNSASLGFAGLTAMIIGSTIRSRYLHYSWRYGRQRSPYRQCPHRLGNMRHRHVHSDDVFLRTQQVKPELTNGIYSYAKEGFGEFVGFNSAWGYWMSALISNVSYITLLFGALGYFFPGVSAREQYRFHLMRITAGMAAGVPCPERSRPGHLYHHHRDGMQAGPYLRIYSSDPSCFKIQHRHLHGQFLGRRHYASDYSDNGHYLFHSVGVHRSRGRRRPLGPSQRFQRRGEGFHHRISGTSRPLRHRRHPQHGRTD